MTGVFKFLSALVNIYMTILFVRIVLTWFSWLRHGTLYSLLARITDPYLHWFRRFPLRLGTIDFSPVVAITTLSLVNSIVSQLAGSGRITVGIILFIILNMAGNMAFFVLGFLILICALRLIAQLARFDTRNQFWYMVDSIFQPVAYKITRTIFKNRIINFTHSCLISIAILVIANLLVRFIINLVSLVLMRLPL